MTAEAPALICSAKGCRDAAAHALLWKNPSLHTEERRKVWLACDEHREHLEEFLTLRSFLRETVDAHAIPEGAG